MATESLGYMLQGVSQQQPKVRQPGQVQDQLNFHSDVNLGLTTRPYSELIGDFASPPSRTSKDITVEIDQELFRLVLRDGALPRVFDYTGQERAVTGTGAAYCSRNSAVYVYDDTCYVANRDTVVAADAAYDPTADVVQNVGYAFALGGAFSRRYSIKIEWGASYTVTGVYTTPAGTEAGDAEQASADYIITQLRQDIIDKLAAASLTNLTVERSGAHLMIYSDTDPVRDVETKDGDAGEYLKGGVAEAKDISVLPKYAYNGMLVKITGDTSADDDFWMRFQTNNTSIAIGAGFGRPGVWREWFDVSAGLQFDASTMPHILTLNPDGTFTFGPQTWLGRRVGNEDSNKTPSFVGTTIKDVREMQERLVFITGASTIVMSRTDRPTDFFRKTVVADTVTDTIDIRATDEGTVPLEYMVAFDRDLFIFAKNAQFVISGAGAITPQNASTALATKYTMSADTKPVVTGRTVLLPFTGARYSGVNEYFTADDYATHAVDNLSKTTSKYIDGRIVDIAVSANDGLAFFLTDNSYDNGEIYVYKFLWENLQKVQSAWYKWKMPEGVRHIYCKDGVLYAWLVHNATAVQPRESLVRMRLDIPAHAELSFPVCLDMQKDITIAVDDEAEFLDVSSYYRDQAFVLISDDPTSPKGASIEPDSIIDNGTEIVYRFNLWDREWLTECILIQGFRYYRSVKPTRPFARKFDGTPRSDVQVLIHSLYVDYEDSGVFNVDMVSALRGNTVMASNDWFPTDDDPLNPWEVATRSGTLQSVWGEMAHLAEIQVSSDDHRPTTLMEIRFEPEYFREGG